MSYTVSLDVQQFVQQLKIGEVASKSGLPVKTVRYYEEIGLLGPTVQRSESGYRLFDHQVLNRLAFIKQAKSFGLSLNEIKTILDLHDQGQLPCAEVKLMVQQKLVEIAEQIKALEALRGELQGLLSGWQDRPSADRIARTICPNIQLD